jgi:large subunit ribosomal protein L17
MRHMKAGVKLNRTTSHRQAMFKNMVTSLFKHDRIRTTDVKAKELRRWAEHIITLAKRGDLHARRQVMAIMQEKDVVHKLFENAGKRFGALKGGYTRIIKIGRRPGDAAPISMIELMASEPAVKSTKQGKGTTKKKESVPAPAPEATAATSAEEQVADSGPQAEELPPAQEVEAQPEPAGEGDMEIQASAAAGADAAEEDSAPAAVQNDQDAEEPDNK